MPLPPSHPTALKGSWPLVGHFAAFRRDPVHFLESVHDACGDWATFRIGPTRMHLLTHPELLHTVLIRRSKHYGKSPLYAQLEPILGQGLVTASWPRWSRDRPLVQPAFHTDALSKLTNALVSNTHQMVSHWSDGQTLDLSEAMSTHALDNMATALFSTDMATPDTQAMIRVLPRAMQIIYARMFRPVNLPLQWPTSEGAAMREAIATMRRVVDAIRASRRASDQSYRDVLSMLMDARDASGAGLTDEAIRDQLATFVQAGHETTALALTWTWLCLSQHPEEEEAMRAEVDSVVGSRRVTWADLPKLKRVGRVFDEVLRLYPPAWWIGRSPLNVETIGATQVRPGDIVSFSPYLMHRHPAYWDAPRAFRPERFERADAHVPCQYIPFAAGPRRCIGSAFARMEWMVVVATLLQRVRIRVLDPTLNTRADIVLRPAEAVRARIEVRGV